MVKKAFAIVLTTLLLVPQFAFARFNAKPGMNFFSPEQDVQMGQKYAQEVEKQTPLLNDPAINQYIQRLGQKLAAKAPGPQYPYTFKVVNQKEINAFALPGGPIYVNLGTIQAADTEAQLAGVMAHEIGHVVMRHSTNQASKQVLAQAPLAVLGGKMGGGALGQLAQMGIGFGVGSVFLKYSRDAERQADLVGTDIIHDAGYDPRAMAQFFEKLQSQGGARGPQFMSDHPDPGNRAEAVAAEAATLPKMNYQSDSSDFRAIKQKVSGKDFAAQQAQPGQGGAASVAGTIARSKDIQPSNNYKSFDHSAFTMTYPDNWTLSGDANSSVTIAPKGGAAGDAVAFGAVINGVKPQQGASLEAATSQLVAQMQQGGGLKQVGGGENFTLNGRPARSVVFLGPSPLQGEQERDWLVTQQRQDGTLMYVVFVSPEKDFESLKPAFQKMLKSFKVK